VYVCARCAVYTESTLSASLTSFIAAMSVPFSKSREQMSLWPLQAARCNAVSPCYNNRETETDRSGRGTQRRMGMVQGLAGYIRVG
jgi:hypothetical protein